MIECSICQNLYPKEEIQHHRGLRICHNCIKTDWIDDLIDELEIKFENEGSY